jgi:hypothetical protein
MSSVERTLFIISRTLSFGVSAAITMFSILRLKGRI